VGATVTRHATARTQESLMCMRHLLAVSAIAVATVACSSPQYIISSKTGQMMVSYGKPELDSKTGLYTYKDSEGKKVTISKDEVGQIMER